MENIYAEISIANTIVPYLRQATSSELEFVSIAPAIGASDVVIDATKEGLKAGDQYEIVLESFDASSQVGSALKTDRIIVKLVNANPPIFET